MPYDKATFPIDIADADLTAAEDALRAVPGVNRVYLSGAIQMAYIEYDPSRCDADVLKTALLGAQGRPTEAMLSEPPAPASSTKVRTPWRRAALVLAQLVGWNRVP